MAYSTKKYNKKMAKGGEIKRGDSDEMSSYARKDIENPEEKGVHQVAYGNARHSPGESNVGNSLRNDPGFKKNGQLGLMQQNGRREEHKRILKDLKSNPKPTSGMSGFAEGGEVESAMHGEESDEDMLDMVGRIIAKHMYSKGGMVANDVGVAEADEKPAEFDDLVLDDHLEGEQPEDSNEHGDDVISKIMGKRKK